MKAAEAILYDAYCKLGIGEYFAADWITIVGAYSREGRHYHNFDHLQEGLCLLWDLYPFDISKPQALFAYAWHDFYQKVANAELESARAAVAHLRTRIKASKTLDAICDFVFDAIMVTAGHDTDRPALRWMVDADLYRFAAPLERYGLTKTFTDYSDEIRLEYAEHNDDAFNQGRRVVLEHYRARGTQFFYYLGDSNKALANIDAAIAELKGH